jgi:hypothetical protein
MQNYLVAAIRTLRPNSEFTFVNDDYSTIEWHVLEGDAPTKAEIEKAIKEVKVNELANAEAKAASKAALLERLGITEDEAKLLLS